jgi:uncharacterized membrane protein
MIEINSIFSCFCHQAVERSPQFGGEIFPVCFRCAGIYLGIFSTYITMYLSKRFLRTPDSKREVFVISILFFPLMIDGLGNALGFWQSTPFVRSFTGLSAGILLAIVLIPFLPFDKAQKNFVEHCNTGYILYPFLSAFVLIILLFFPINKIVFNALSFLVASGLFLILINLFLFWKYYNPKVVNNNI